MQGTLDDFDLRYVFRFLSATRKTGKLTVRGPAASGRVFFRGGEIYHAESDQRREGFGRKLVRAGKISEEQFRSTLEESAAAGRRLGDAFVDRGLVDGADLESALCEEIQDVALGLFRNGSGRFEFTSGEEVESDTLILVPVETLIAEDSQAFNQKVPVLSPVPPGGRKGSVNVSPEEWRVIASIDGRRTVADIARQARMSDFSVLRTLRRLRSLGLVVLSGDDVAGDRAPAPWGAIERTPDGSAATRAAGRPPPPPPPPAVIDLVERAPAQTSPRAHDELDTSEAPGIALRRLRRDPS